jgi:FMN phosphatase YigB (HAD superfamily)
MDVGDVVVRTVPMAQCRSLARHTGLSWEHVAVAVDGSGIVTAFQTGRLAPAEFTAAVRGLLRRPALGHDRVREAWNAVVAGVEPVVAAAAARLAAAGRLILASNTDPFHWQVVRERLAEARVAAPACLSFEVGCTKPSPGFFAALVSGDPRVAEGSVYVDDREDSVAEAARRGMAGFLHRDPAVTAAFLGGLLE